MSLTAVRSGEAVCVERLELSSAALLRLGELGLLPGEEFAVLRTQRLCPLVLGPGSAQLMLGRDIGRGIIVRPLALHEPR